MTPDPAVARQEVLALARDRAAQRVASGTLSRDEIARVAAIRLSIEERLDYGREIDDALAWLQDHWEATGVPDIPARDRRSAAREGLKRLLRALLSPASRLLFRRQSQFNSRLVHLLGASLSATRDNHDETVRRLDQLAMALEREADDLGRRIAEIEGRLAAKSPRGEDGGGG